MEGIASLLQPDVLGDVVEQKQGELINPLNAFKPQPDVYNDRLHEIMDELGKIDSKPIGHTDSQLEFLDELSKIIIKETTPQYIQDKKYIKNPFSFFIGGYDANADIGFNPDKVEKEFQDFLKTTEHPRFNYILDSDTLSPFAENLLPYLARYKQKYRTLPTSFDDFIKNRQTLKG